MKTINDIARLALVKGTAEREKVYEALDWSYDFERYDSALLTIAEDYNEEEPIEFDFYSLAHEIIYYSDIGAYYANHVQDVDAQFLNGATTVSMAVNMAFAENFSDDCSALVDILKQLQAEQDEDDEEDSE